jgi:hypothetical protein
MRVRLTGHVARKRGCNAYRVFAGKPEEWDGMDWIHLAEDRDQGQAVGNSNELLSSIKCWKFFV